MACNDVRRFLGHLVFTIAPDDWRLRIHIIVLDCCARRDPCVTKHQGDSLMTQDISKHATAKKKLCNSG